MKRDVKKIKKVIKTPDKSIDNMAGPYYSKFIVAAVFVLMLVFGGVVIRLAGHYFVGEVIQTVVIDNNDVEMAATTTEANFIVGAKAPAFSLAGNRATSTNLLGLLNKPLAVVFWVTWQPASVDQIRAFDEYLAKMENPEFNVVFINYQEDDLLVQSFLRRSGYDVSVLFDETGEAGNAWQVYTTPTTYLVGTDGFIKEKIIGNYSVEAVVDKLLNINR